MSNLQQLLKSTLIGLGEKTAAHQITEAFHKSRAIDRKFILNEELPQYSPKSQYDASIHIDALRDQLTYSDETSWDQWHLLALSLPHHSNGERDTSHDLLKGVVEQLQQSQTLDQDLVATLIKNLPPRPDVYWPEPLMYGSEFPIPAGFTEEDHRVNGKNK